MLPGDNDKDINLQFEGVVNFNLLIGQNKASNFYRFHYRLMIGL